MLANGSYTHEHNTADAENNMNKDVIIPIFYREKQFNPQKSEVAQRSIYDEYDAAKFLIPGDDKTVHIERATLEHTRRWPRQWEAYKAGQDQSTGMPLDAWYQAQRHPAILEEMLALKIRTVEDLANLNDDFAGRTGWGREWREKARTELKSHTQRAEIEKANEGLTEKLQTQEKELEEMRRLMTAMQEQIAANASGNVEPLKRGPGRPPKQD
jgi:hypothetical protein